MIKDRACANGPAMSRRTLLAALPAATAASVAPAASPEDPVLSLYQKWLTARDGAFSFEDSCPEQEAFLAQMSELFDEMVEMGACTWEGLAGLVHVLWIWDGPVLRPDTPDYQEELQETKNLMIAAIWRSASGRDGWPRWA